MTLPDPTSPATLLGFAGIALNFLWPLLQGRRSMLAVQVLSGSCFVGHYALLGAATGSVMNLLAVIQALVAIPLGQRPGFRHLYLLTLPFIAVGVVLSWMGWPSLWAALAMTGTSIGRYQTRVLYFRLILLASIPCWTAHNWLVGSVPGLLSDLLVSTAGVIGLWRMHRLSRSVTALQSVAGTE